MMSDKNRPYCCGNVRDALDEVTSERDALRAEVDRLGLVYDDSKRIATLEAALREASYRLYEHRTYCGCLSMAGTCHRCQKTQRIEEQCSAALKEAHGGGDD